MDPDDSLTGGGPPSWTGARRTDPEPPPPLAAATVEAFVVWAASLPGGEVDLLRARIEADCDVAVVAALGRALHSLPVGDCGFHLMLMAILGESRRPAALEPLERFAWTTGEIIEAIEYPIGALGPGVIDCDLRFDMSPALRARAVEMLAYLGSAEAFAATLRIAREHPEADVRHAAIDAYLFNHGDSPEAEAEIRRTLRDEDQDWVGIPRRTADMDGARFDARLEMLQNEAEPPLEPKRATSPARPPADDRSHDSGRDPAFR
jgi:hypothetical protein